MCHDCTLQKYPERILIDGLRLGIFAVCQKKRKKKSLLQCYVDVFTQSMIILKMDHLEDLSILSLTSFVVCTFFRKKIAGFLCFGIRF